MSSRHYTNCNRTQVGIKPKDMEASSTEKCNSSNTASKSNADIDFQGSKLKPLSNSQFDLLMDDSEFDNFLSTIDNNKLEDLFCGCRALESPVDKPATVQIHHNSAQPLNRYTCNNIFNIQATTYQGLPIPHFNNCYNVTIEYNLK